MIIVPNILIVEDEQYCRQRLADAVNDNPGLQLLAAVATFKDAQQYLQDLRPDVLLTDLDLPDGNGIDLIHQARAQGHTESLVITVFGDEKHVISALSAGASGYLLKDCDAMDLGHAVIQLLDGGSPISPAIARHLLRLFNGERQTEEVQSQTTNIDKKPDLTKREYQVLQLIAKGYTYQEIANSLHLSIHTVTSHIKHIYRKLAVGSRGEAVYEAAQIGLL